MRTVEMAVQAVAREGSQLILFPELFSCGYDCKATKIGDTAWEVGGKELDRVGSLARKHGIAVCLPYAERLVVDGVRGGLANSCALFDCEGHLVLNYRKINLYGPWEKETFLPGGPEGLECVLLRLKGNRSVRCGVVICYDLEFPEPARCLAVQGAELLLAPTALPLPNDVCDQSLNTIPLKVVPTRALENGLFVLYSNLEGDAEAVPGQGVTGFCGCSAIIAPDGEDLGRLGGLTGGASLSAVLRLDDYSRLKRENPYMADHAARVRAGHYKVLLCPPELPGHRGLDSQQQARAATPDAYELSLISNPIEALDLVAETAARLSQAAKPVEPVELEEGSKKRKAPRAGEEASPCHRPRTL
ncbi:hypothetical protein CYMTET_31936 [Cymbomonas tetramitiformis]|uniref:CN hydrolase domain-containing protein n=1 Tax=Cymbomonas tetramitiformis TaxID=36881 RepID=A0AAE0FG43_9CHLO|nr:hypothetical protein CYMTET_31936 [Cymbomonas tetramitiformis]